MRLPIDTQTVKFAAAGPAEPVLDYETRAPKLDENGTALFNVPLFAAGSGVKDSITVKAGEQDMTLQPGKTVSVKLAEGTQIVATNTTPNYAAGSVISVVSSQLSDNTLVLR